MRQRHANDAAALFALFDQAAFRHHGSTLDPFTAIEDAERLLRAGSPNAFEIVGHRGVDLVGYAGVFPMVGRQGHTGTLTVGVHEAFWGRGIGGALLACLITTARVMMGLSRLQLTVFVDNSRAIALYERFGFATEGRIARFVKRPEGFVDALLMARLTAEP